MVDAGLEVDRLQQEVDMIHQEDTLWEEGMQALQEGMLGWLLEGTLQGEGRILQGVGHILLGAGHILLGVGHILLGVGHILQGVGHILLAATVGLQVEVC